MRVGEQRYKTGRDCSDMASSQQSVWLLETKGQSLSRALARAEPAKALDVTFWPPEL